MGQLLYNCFGTIVTGMHTKWQKNSVLLSSHLLLVKRAKRSMQQYLQDKKDYTDINFFLLCWPKGGGNLLLMTHKIISNPKHGGTDT